METLKFEQEPKKIEAGAETLEAEIESETETLDQSMAETAKLLEDADLEKLPAEKRRSIFQRANLALGAYIFAAGIGGMLGIMPAEYEKELSPKAKNAFVGSGIAMIGGIQLLKHALDERFPEESKKEE